MYFGIFLYHSFTSPGLGHLTIYSPLIPTPLLSALECNKASNLRDEEEVVKAIKTSIASMQYGNEDFLAGLVAKACGECMPTLFNEEDIDSCSAMFCHSKCLAY